MDHRAEVASWAELWKEHLDLYVDIVEQKPFDTPLWYDERPMMGLLLQALAKKYDQNMVALVDHPWESPESKHGRWRPDLWIKFKESTGAVWIEGKLCEVKFDVKKQWNTSGLELFRKQSNGDEKSANVRLKHLREQPVASGYQPGDILVHVHFVVACIAQHLWNAWKPQERTDRMDELHAAIVGKNLGTSVGWNDRRFDDGVPKDYPEENIKREEEHARPGAFFVTQVLG